MVTALFLAIGAPLGAQQFDPGGSYGGGGFGGSTSGGPRFDPGGSYGSGSGYGGAQFDPGGGYNAGGYGYAGGYNPYGNNSGYSNTGYRSKAGEILGTLLGGIAQMSVARNIGRAQQVAARGHYYGPEAQEKAGRIAAMTAQENAVSDAVADRTLGGADLSYQGAVGADGSSVRGMSVSGGRPVARGYYEPQDDEQAAAWARRAAYGQGILDGLDRLQGRAPSDTADQPPATTPRFSNPAQQAQYQHELDRLRTKFRSGRRTVTVVSANRRDHQVEEAGESEDKPEPPDPPKPKRRKAPKKKAPATAPKTAAPVAVEGRACDPNDVGP